MTELPHVHDPLARVRELMREQRFIEAVACLHISLQGQTDAVSEALLADCRYQAFRVSPPSSSPQAAWPPTGFDVDRFGGIKGIPEISADELTPASLSAGIFGHGALLVRGLLDRMRAEQLATGVRESLQACEAWHRDGGGLFTSPWYARLALPDDCDLAPARVWVESAGGVWTADSPRMLEQLIALFEERGVIAAIAGHFGERPMLSVGKSTLRRVPASIQLADWHQDGAFMGSDIRSVNVWLSLSHCGSDASGLEYLPRRLERVLPTGSLGANFDWSVGPGMVEQARAGVATVAPVFAPGDALLFDHFFLHRTGIPAGIAKDRYAIESWFFAPSAYPAQQVPLLL